MRPKTWTSPEQALALLQEASRSPLPIVAFCWQKDLRPQTFYRWRKKYLHLLSAVLLGLAPGLWPAQGGGLQRLEAPSAGTPATGGVLGQP